MSLPHSVAVRGWIISVISLVLVMSDPTRQTIGKNHKYLSYTVLLFAYFLAQFGYNLSTRDSSADTYIAIMQTFAYEALSFSVSYGEIGAQITVIFIGLGFIIFANSQFSSGKAKSPLLNPTTVGILLLLCGFFMLAPSLSSKLQKFYEAWQQIQKEKELFARATHDFLKPLLIKGDTRNLSVVTIIGESTSRWNVSLYGYPRKTFEPLKGVPNILLFHDVIAPHTHTVPSLSLALTSAEFSPPDAGNRDPVSANNLQGKAPYTKSNTELSDLESSATFQRVILYFRQMLCAFKTEKGMTKCVGRALEDEYVGLLATSELFDPAWYLDTNTHVHSAGINPIKHYLRRGAREGRDPSPFFSTNDYIRQYPDVPTSGLNPLVHYITIGKREGREIFPSTRAHQRVELQSSVVPLIGVLNAAGIQTLWFSNQNEFGIWDNPISHHAKMARHTYFHRKSLGYFKTHRYFDGDLVSTAIARTGRLPVRAAMFLHFYAAHAPYCDVVPKPADWEQDVLSSLPNAAIFGRFAKVKRDRLNCYDSAVHYVAKNIRRVVDWVSMNDNPVVLLYFPDHGEDVFLGRAHESSRFTHKMAQVPFLVFFNDAAKKEHDNLFRTLKGHETVPVNLENMFDLILDLFSIRLKHYSVTERSIASAAFKPENRLILDRGPGGYVSFDEVPKGGRSKSADLADSYIFQRRQLNLMPLTMRDKVCAHRNNSLLKFMEALSLFNCLEIDVIMNEAAGAAMVHHDSNDPTGLPLDVLLALSAVKGKRIWLDVKNLSDDNVGLLLAPLKRFDRSDKDTLVEVQASTAGSAAVKRLSEAGYTVSYYLPNKLGIKCAANGSTGECAEFAAKVEHDLQSDFKSLSFDIKASQFVSALKLPFHISLSTWDLHADLVSLGKRPEIAKYNMFIVPYSSDFDH